MCVLQTPPPVSEIEIRTYSVCVCHAQLYTKYIRDAMIFLRLFRAEEAEHLPTTIIMCVLLRPPPPASEIETARETA